MSRIVSVNMDQPDPDPSTGPDDNLFDMDMVHDFGAGEGIDMRDFPSHSGDELPEIVEPKEEDREQTPTPSLPQHRPQPTPVTHATPATMVNGHDNTIPSSATVSTEPPSSTVDVEDMFQTETGMDGDDDDDDGDDDGPSGGKRVRHNDVPGGFTYVDKDGESGRRKIRIEYITDKSRRHITFSKRKAGIMKKAYELSILTGTQVLLLVVSETGLVYTFTTTKLQPLVQKPEGKNLIQACLNAPDGYGPDGQPISGPVAATKAKNGGLAIRPHKLTAAASAAMAASAQAASQAMSLPVDESASHAQAQADAAAAIGQGTPIAQRPKKRMPSGKGKKSMTIASSEMGSNGLDMIPPVPQIPDMHRQASPQMMNHLSSPMSAGYHIPPEYQHHQPSPTTANYGYPPDYAAAYYGQGGPHPNYLGVPGPQHAMTPQQAQAHAQAQYQHEARERARMMMDPGRLGMGM